MTKRIILAALAALFIAAPGLSQPVTAAVAVAPKDDLVRVRIDTSEGPIVLALDRGRAPVTTRNFLDYVDQGKFNGETFYRAMPYGKGGLIQGGITSDSRKLAKPIAHEPTSQTGLKHIAGAVSMAAGGPGTAQSDFFILTTDMPAFDATVSDPGFAVFGHVVEGMDVVKRIFAAPLSPTKGAGSMKGQMLEPAVKISKAARLP
ncbi:MAG: peptidylprolyl isomerase [Pseudomonadota bacterium]|nr:peptidylprolyl isomerase [Pseudomonadota bacterium]